MRTRHAAAVLGCAMIGLAGAARAENVVFTPLASAYADEKGRALKAPEGVACGDDGTVVVADTGNARLVQYRWKGGSFSGGKEMKFPQITYPIRPQLDRKGELWVLDGERRIVHVAANGATAAPFDLKEAPDAARLVPAAFRLDASGSIFVLDAAAPRVVRLSVLGAYQGQWALPAKGTFTDILVDPAGALLALEALSATVQQSPAPGQPFSELGKSLREFSSFPTYLTADAKGMLFVVDNHGHGVVLLGHDGAYHGRQLSLGWTEGLVYYPTQLCFNGSGEVFVADRSNNRVQAFATGR